MKDVPVPKDGPPEDSAYQFIVPALELAAKTTVPVPQLELEVVPDIVGALLTFTVTLWLDE